MHWFLCFTGKRVVDGKAEPSWIKVYGPFLHKKEVDNTKTIMQNRGYVWQNSEEILFAKSQADAVQEYKKLQCDKLLG